MKELSGHQRYRLIEADVTGGNTRDIIDDKTQTFIYDNRIYPYYLPSTNEFIYTSEKDGWQYIYSMDALTGTQK